MQVSGLLVEFILHRVSWHNFDISIDSFRRVLARRQAMPGMRLKEPP